MKSILLASLAMFIACASQALTHSWTNILGGDWSVAANWLPHGVPLADDDVLIMSNGTYTVTILSNSVQVANLTLGGSSGTQTLLNGTVNVLIMTNFGSVRANGILSVTNGGLQGKLSVASGGQLNLGGSAGKFLYNFALTNAGTVNWSGGGLSVGGNNSLTTFITNSGLWQMTGDNNMGYGGGSTPIFQNTGTIRKMTGTGTSAFSGMDLINLPGGIVDVLSGTLQLIPGQTNYLGGTLTTTSPAAMSFLNGNWTDAGGIVYVNGTVKLSCGNFYLRTNIIAGIQLIGGDLYPNPDTFQQAGAITNLTIDGATLHGTNRISGTLTFNVGGLVGKLTVQPSGQLLFNTAGSKLLYSLNLVNQGSVMWNAGGLSVGATPPTIISNGGSWQMSSDDNISYGGGNTPYFTNYGTIRKIAGTGTSGFAGFPVLNQPGGLIQADTGNIALPSGYTNLAGILRLNGGQFQTFGGITLNGGTLDGSGTVGQNALIGGTITPGQNGSGAIGFSSGLNFGSNATLVLDGTSTSQYDRLSVTGAVSLANCTLQVSSLPYCSHRYSLCHHQQRWRGCRHRDIQWSSGKFTHQREWTTFQNSLRRRNR